MTDAGPILGSPVTAYNRRDKSKDMRATISTSIPNVVQDDSTVRRSLARDSIQLPTSSVQQSSSTLSVNEPHSKILKVLNSISGNTNYMIGLGDPVQQEDLVSSIDSPENYDFYRVRDPPDEIYIVRRKPKTITVLRKRTQTDSVISRPPKEPRLQTPRPGRVAGAHRSAQPNSHIDQANTARNPSVADSLCADNTSTGSRALPARLPTESSAIPRIPLSCFDCNEEFVELKEFTYHLLNSHYGQLRVDCAPCKFSDNTYNKWVRHLIDEHHLGEDPLPCPGCDEKFSVVHKLRKHYMAYPSGSHGKPKPCPECTRINAGKGRFRLGSDQCMNCSI